MIPTRGAGVDPDAGAGPHTERNLSPKRAALPTGTVTFLFADIEGSTRLAHALTEAEWAALLGRHDALVEEGAAPSIEEAIELALVE